MQQPNTELLAIVEVDKADLDLPGWYGPGEAAGNEAARQVVQAMPYPCFPAKPIFSLWVALILLAYSPLTSAAGPSNSVTPDFVDCVARTTIALDDAVTSADSIATGVLAKCRSELPAIQAGSSEFTARVMSVLVASVMVHREQVRQRGPERPLAPLPNAPANRPVIKPTT